jgi:Allene oxide cyclase barrel like domain
VKKYLVVVLAVAMATVFAIVASSGAQTPGPRTITVKETEKGGEFKFIDVKPLQPPRSERGSMGDMYIFTSRLLDASGKRVGELSAKCTTIKTKSKGAELCEGVAHFNDGDLLLSARVTPDPGVKGAIVGGTGAYANARGTFTSVGEEVSTDTFVFTQ